MSVFLDLCAIRLFLCTPRLLIYGEYCSRMEHAQSTLNQLLASREDFRQKVEVTGLPGGPAWPWPHSEIVARWPEPVRHQLPSCHPVGKACSVICPLFSGIFLLLHFVGWRPEHSLSPLGAVELA